MVLRTEHLERSAGSRDVYMRRCLSLSVGSTFIVVESLFGYAIFVRCQIIPRIFRVTDSGAKHTQAQLGSHGLQV